MIPKTKIQQGDILSMGGLPKISNLGKYLLIRMIIITIIVIFKPSMPYTLAIITIVIATTMLYGDIKRKKVTKFTKVLLNLTKLNVVVALIYYLIFFTTTYFGSKGIIIAAVIIGGFFILRRRKEYVLAVSTIAKMLISLKEEKNNEKIRERTKGHGKTIRHKE